MLSLTWALNARRRCYVRPAAGVCCIAVTPVGPPMPTGAMHLRIGAESLGGLPGSTPTGLPATTGVDRPPVAPDGTPWLGRHKA